MLTSIPSLRRSRVAGSSIATTSLASLGLMSREAFSVFRNSTIARQYALAAWCVRSLRLCLKLSRIWS